VVLAGPQEAVEQKEEVPRSQALAPLEAEVLQVPEAVAAEAVEVAAQREAGAVSGPRQAPAPLPEPGQLAPRPTQRRRRR
jgi:hypothetical protein